MKRNKLYNVIFPIWLLVFLPPIILLVIPANFLIDFIVLLIILKAMKIQNIKNILKKDYLKVVGFGFLADIIGGILLFITIFIDPLSNMAWNPYSNIISGLYLIISFGISTYLIYYFNNKYNFKKSISDKKIIKKISIILAITTAPYLFLIPTSMMYKSPVTISNYYNTSITNGKKMMAIESHINNGDIEKFEIDEENYTITISLQDNDSYYNLYKDLEEKASLLFKTITKLNNVVFKVNNKEYTFDYNYINKIYNNDIKNDNYSEVYARYSNQYFTDYIYLGNVNGKYDIFDASENCSTNISEIYEDDYFKYSISCNEIDKVFILADVQEINIKEALKNNMFSINDLSNADINIYKEAK